jgi:ATP-dependent Clp protease ATP-binding subunit ClpX
LTKRLCEISLTKPKNALIKQYIKLFEMEGIDLTIDEEVIDLIVDKAFEFKLGARGLRSICEAVMMDYMYDVPSKEGITELHVTLNIANHRIDQFRLKSLKAA